MAAVHLQRVLKRATRLDEETWAHVLRVFERQGDLREQLRLAHVATAGEGNEVWNSWYETVFLPLLDKSGAPEYAERILNPVIAGEYAREVISEHLYDRLTAWWHLTVGAR